MEEMNILSKSELGSKATILLNSIKTYFSSNNNIDKMIPIITGKSKISLRVLD